MKKIAVILADGFEELEALTPVDLLRRAGVEVTTFSVGKEIVVGSHGIEVIAESFIDAMIPEKFDGIIIPGGMPGAKNIRENERAVSVIKQFIKDKKLVAGICAAPAVVLASIGALGDKRATCYPADDFVKLIDNYTGKDVEIDDNVITANGPKSAFKFALAICEYLKVTPKF